MTTQRGFSLLEMLVAFAIMALSLGLIYRVAGSNAAQVGALSQRQESLWLAESLLAEHAYVPASGWNETGSSAGLHWQAQSQIYDSGIDSPQAVPLHSIELTISWDNGAQPGTLHLKTLRPQRKPLPGETLP